MDGNIASYNRVYRSGIYLKDIKPLSSPTYKIFIKNPHIKITNRKAFYTDPMAFKGIKNFIKFNEYLYMIPITTIKGTIVGYILRGINRSDYCTVSRDFTSTDEKVPLMYGFGKEFKKYDTKESCYPIVVCEGCKDCMAIKQIYPYVLANNTSSMGVNAHILRNISNKFLLAYDNDKAGTEGMDRDKSILRGLGAFVDTLKLPDSINIPGEGERPCKDCAEVSQDPYEFSLLRKQLLRKLKALYEI